MKVLKKKNIILSSIFFSCFAALVSCGSPSSSQNETFNSVPACEEKIPSRFSLNAQVEIPVSLGEMEDGTYAMYQSEFRVETTIKNHPAKFQIWEKVSKQPPAVSGAPSYAIQSGWGCISAKDALAEKTSFMVQSDILRIFKKTGGQVEWLNRRVGIHSNEGAVSRFYNDPTRVVGREPNGSERTEIEILKNSLPGFQRDLGRYWDEYSFSNVVARTYEFHGMKRIDLNTVIHVRIVYNQQKNPAADVSSDLFIPLPTVDALH